MAKSTKLSDKKVWVGFRPGNREIGSLIVQGFEDVLSSEDGVSFSVSESADQRAQAFIQSNKGAQLIEGATKAEHAIELARQKGI